MRRIVTTIAALATLGSVAMAEDAEGVIERIDPSNFTMTLEGGATYKLPEAFDISLIGPGMRVAIAYDVVGSDNMITDMEQVD